MSAPFISVIVPVYNVEQYLDECIRSVLTQDYQDLEIVMVDDGSTDGSGKRCDELAREDPRIKVFHKKNGGLSSARNYGVDRASGKYVIFLDSDDRWCNSSALGTLASAAERTGADVILGEYKSVDMAGNDMPAGRKLPRPDTETPPMENYEFLTEIVKGEFFAWLSLYSLEVFNHIRMNEILYSFEDIDFACRLYQMPLRSVYVPVVFYAYRKRPGSIVNTADSRNLRDSFRMCRAFHEGAERIDDRRLRRYYHRYSVMMYFWTLQTMSEEKYRPYVREDIGIDLSGLRRDVFRWFLRDMAAGFSVVFFLSPAMGIRYLGLRSKASGILSLLRYRFRSKNS